jgi:hypothetical protein
MDCYPHGFPLSSQGAVESEIITAGEIFDSGRELLLADKNSRYGLQDQVTKLIVAYILRVWSAFAHEACKLGLDGTWDVVKIDKEVRDFLDCATHHLSHDRGYDTTGDALKYVPAAVHKTFRDSEERKSYNAERLVIAKTQRDAEPTQDNKGTRRGYREEVLAWMKREELENVAQAAARLHVSKSTLKSIMSSRGTLRYGPDTLQRVLGIMERQKKD